MTMQLPNTVDITCPSAPLTRVANGLTPKRYQRLQMPSKVEWIDRQLCCGDNRWEKLVKGQSHHPIKKADPKAGSIMVNRNLGACCCRATHHFQNFLGNGCLTCLVVVKSQGLSQLLGIVTGMVAGLGTITPASGFVGPMGALIIGLAASIQIVLEEGMIIDTVIQGLAGVLSALPVTVAAIMTTVVQGILNFFIPSGSGQAMVTMPILIPLGDLIGITRQTMVMAFQVGDGLTNLIVPTSGGTLAMLAMGSLGLIRRR